MSVAAIQDELLKLPATERARLIEVLWDSLSEPELKSREAAWVAESERRIDAYESGVFNARDAQTVFRHDSGRNQFAYYPRRRACGLD